MHRNLSKQETIKALAAIHLVAQGVQQKRAAHIIRTNGLNIDESQVAELLKVARARGWFWEESVFNLPAEHLPGGVDAELLAEARAVAGDRGGLEVRLQKIAEGSLQHLSVVYSGDGTDPANWAQRLEHFGHGASRQLLRMLAGAQKIGVGWGHTVSAVVRALDTPSIRRLPKRDILFIPTCGEPLKPLGPEHHLERACTEIVSLLSDLFDKKKRRLSLAGVVAVEPNAFRTPEGKAFLRDYFDVISDYRDIFGPSRSSVPPYIDRLDAILTSVGSFNQDWKMYTSVLDRAGGTSRDTLATNFKGDIGGAIIPAQNPNREQRHLYEDVSSSWTGITLEHYHRIAQEAPRRGHPGVIVVAIGENKAQIVLEVLKLGLANQLIIDQTLADGLNEMTKHH